ncbi:MAG: response regulator transcription factor [Cyanobacteriota bacterium]
MSTRILVVDDHPMVLRATKDIINDNFKDFEVINCGNAKESINIAKEKKPDLIIMDIVFKEQEVDGITATIEILKDFPQAKIIIVSNEDDISYLTRLQENIPNLHENFGYMLKNEDEETFIEAIKAVLEGNYFYSKLIFKKLLNAGKHTNIELPPLIEPLNDTEFKILKKLAKAKTNEKIAEELGYTRKYIDTKLYEIYQKLLVGNFKDGVIPRVEAVLRAKKYGILTDEEIALEEEVNLA